MQLDFLNYSTYLIVLTKEPRELENSDFDEILHTCRGDG